MRLRKNLFIIRIFLVKIINSEIIRSIPIILLIIIADIAIIIWVIASQIYFLFNRIINWFKKTSHLEPPS